jgi:microcystin-dependent protein
MSIKHLICSAALVSAGLAITTPAHAGTEAYIGELTIGGWNFCPRATARADGTLLSISSNSALFSLLGTTFGGDGRVTFALPDLRGRAPIHNGQGVGLTPRALGESSGSETNTMTVAQMPAHNHAGSVINASNQPGNSANPNGRVLAADSSADRVYQDTAPAVSMSTNGLAIAAQGGGQPMNNMQPYQAVTYCVVTQGIFPSRP